MELDLYKSEPNSAFKIAQYAALIAISTFFLSGIVYWLFKSQLTHVKDLVMNVALTGLIIFIILTIIQKRINDGIVKIGSIVFQDRGFQLNFDDKPSQEIDLKDFLRFRMKLSDYAGEVDVSLQLHFAKNKGIENYIWMDWENKKEYFRFKVPSESEYNYLIKVGYNWQQKFRSILVEY